MSLQPRFVSPVFKMQVGFVAIKLNVSDDLINVRSQSSVVCIVIRVRAGRFGVESRAEPDGFLFSDMSRPSLESPQSPIGKLTGLFLRSEREVHHSTVVPKLRIREFVRELPQWARTTLLLRTALFRVITQRGVVISYRRFVTTRTLEEGTDRLSRNVGEKLPLLAA
jgi:hypothetical protein